MNDFLFLKNNQSLKQPQSTSFQYSLLSSPSSLVVTSAAARTTNINSAFLQLKNSVIQRGTQFAANTAASKGGYMAENFVAESYNLDAVLKQIKVTPATVPAENGLASADVLFDGKSASLKYYVDAKASAKAQLNPEYKDQIRVVPKDQLNDSKNVINEMADRNLQKGRTDVAAEQHKIADKLSDRIKSDSGVESTPLTKEQDLEMAKAITKDGNGNVVVDNERLDKVFEDTGITGRVKSEIVRTELRGLGLAAAIGMGIGFTLTFISEIAQKGLESETISDIAFDSIVAGAEAGLIAGTTYLAGRVATSLLVNKAGLDLSTQFGSIFNSSAIGVLSTAIVCTYQYVKLRISGANVGESLDAVKKTAVSSLSLLAISMISQGVWGGFAGLIVSTSVGVMYFATSIHQNSHAQKIELRLREYSIEEYKNLIEEKQMILIS